MDASNQYPNGQYPPTNYLAAAIRKLPKPGPGVSPQTVEIDAGSGVGRYSVTFIARQSSDLARRAWFWGVQSGRRLTIGQFGTEGK